MSTPLVIGPEVRAEVAKVIEFAETHRIPAIEMHRLMNTPGYGDRPKGRICIPFGFHCNFTIEEVQERKSGEWFWARHLSISMENPHRVPHPVAVWMIAQEFGFWGDGLGWCQAVYWQDITPGGVPSQAINIVQAYDRADLERIAP